MTLQWAILAAIIGHVVLISSSIPSVMDNPSGALGCFAIGLVIMGLGTGGFKANVSPLLAEQIKETRPRIITTKTGERVILDPQVTISRVFLYFYLQINLGALAGGIGMVYVERFVGFWLAYALPTFLFFFAPIVLIACKKFYILTPPTGSVLSRAFALLRLASKGCWSLNPVTTYKNLYVYTLFATFGWLRGCDSIVPISIVSRHCADLFERISKRNLRRAIKQAGDTY